MHMYQRGIASAFPVYPGMGLGGYRRYGAGLRRVGTHFNLQEVRMMRVRLVCIRLPKLMSGMVRLLAGKRRT